VSAVWWLEFRRSPGRWLGPALIVLGIVTVSQDGSYWVGNWQATSIQAQFTTVIAGPLLAGCAAWAAARGRRHGHETLAVTTPRADLVTALVQWSAVTAWGLLAYLVVLVLAVVRTAPAAVSGGPWPSYLALGAIALVAYSAVGYGLGRALPSRLVAPLAALAVFVYLTVLAFTGPWVSRLALYYGDILVSPATRLRMSVWLAELAWGAALVVVACALMTWRRTEWSRRIAVLVAATLPAVAVVLVARSLGPDDLVPRPPAAQPVCRGDAPRVCLWPEHGKWAQDAAAVATGLSAALTGVYQFPATVYEAGLQPGAPATGPEVRIDTLPVTRVSMVAGLGDEIAPSVPPPCLRRDSERFQRYALLRAWLNVKAAGTIGPSVMVDGARLERIFALDAPRQQQWVRDSIRAVRDCTAPLGASP
jgi:hypothetical protein